MNGQVEEEVRGTSVDKEKDAGKDKKRTEKKTKSREKTKAEKGVRWHVEREIKREK